ncbi:hypothetical protein B9Z65_7204 [Elsinoe australis]|uniref:Uncharacterized protein n=1 Tax=Elsinoe australis TaxID=40998 RepID=A0A2P7Z631_9PEZI|nr:hypothetical protein B9Z65_7204 [Elsinoe australis]
MRHHFALSLLALILASTANAGIYVPQTTLLVSATTPVPASAITAAPIHKDLQRRAPFTCGYVSGQGASALTCPNGYSCYNTIGAGSVRWACCNELGCVNDYALCNDYGTQGCASFQLEPSVCSSIYGGPILSCSSEAPSCMRYARSSTLGDSLVYYSLTCGMEARDIPVLLTTTGGPGSKSSPTGSGLGGMVTSSALNINSILGNGASSSTALSGNSGSSTSTSSTGSTSGTSGLSTRAIIAIVVGGIAAIIVASIIGCCCWRHHRTNRAHVIDPHPRPNVEYLAGQSVAPGSFAPGSVTNGSTSNTFRWAAGVPPGAHPNIPPMQPMSEASFSQR